jgi:CRP-like cAMP-binding protein
MEYGINKTHTAHEQFEIMIKEDRLKEKVSEFASLSNESFEFLFSCATQIKLLKGQYLLTEKQVCNYLYFVEEGLLRTFINQDDNVINFDFSLEGNFLSNLESLKKQELSKISIIAEKKSIIILFDKDALFKLSSQFAEIDVFCKRILRYLLISRDELLKFYRLKTPKERYFFLVKNNPKLIQQVSITQLSSYIGVTRETLSRIRKSIK